MGVSRAYAELRRQQREAREQEPFAHIPEEATEGPSGSPRRDFTEERLEARAMGDLDDREALQRQAHQSRTGPSKGCYLCDNGQKACICGMPMGPSRGEVRVAAAAITNLLEAADTGTLPKEVAEMVVLPEHYARFKIEPIRFVGENGLNFFQGNIIKYVMRWDAKDGLQDLEKAARYLTMWIKLLRGDPDWWRKPA